MYTVFCLGQHIIKCYTGHLSYDKTAEIISSISLLLSCSYHNITACFTLDFPNDYYLQTSPLD